MVRLDERVLVFANNFLDSLLGVSFPCMEDDIKAAVKLTKSKKVVICWVQDFNWIKIVPLEEIFEKGGPRSIFGVDISISPNEDVGLKVARL